MEDKTNCGECYFHDDINQPEKKIHCILHQEWRGQYTGCKHWTPHRNDSPYIKEVKAKDLRDKIEQEKQKQRFEEDQNETKTLIHESISETKKQGKKGAKMDQI